MSLRVYTCFDATGTKNPAQTDLKYYFLLRAWQRREPLAGAFIDVHRSEAPLPVPRRLSEELAGRLRSSDLLLVILSQRTPSSVGWLAWEIEFATERCGLPIVCGYVDVDRVTGDEGCRDFWPPSLANALPQLRQRSLHVPFRPHSLARAFHRLAASAKTASQAPGNGAPTRYSSTSSAS